MKMPFISPLTKKRLKNFRRIKRAWWSLWALAGIFLLTLFADFISPYSPNEVIDPATLEKYRQSEVERTYEIRTARFNLKQDGSIKDFEGPEDVYTNIVSLVLSPEPIKAISDGVKDEYKVRTVKRKGYTRFFLEPQKPAKVIEKILPPSHISYPMRPVKEHPFGLDAGGRDVFTRIIHGMRIALIFGLALTLSGMFFGLVIGALEGYFGGKIDILLQRFTEIWSAIPFLYVMIFIGSTLGRSFGVLLFCYAIFNWIAVSYYMRSEFMRLRTRTFVEAAKVQGYSTARILFVHILPNALTPLITLFPFLLMGAIASLASLDFLGFGLPPMTPSCGELLNQAQQFRFAWWLVAFPSAALFTVMLLTVFIGEGLRDAFDPRQESRLE